MLVIIDLSSGKPGSSMWMSHGGSAMTTLIRPDGGFPEGGPMLRGASGGEFRYDRRPLAKGASGRNNVWMFPEIGGSFFWVSLQ